MSNLMGMDALRNNLTNPQRTFLWEFEIPAPKGLGSSDIWIIRATSLEEPGRRFDPILIPFKGTGGMVVPGKEVYSHMLTVKIQEGEDAKTYEAIQSWMRLVRDNVAGTGLGDPDLKTDAVLTLLSTKGTVAKRIKLVGMYPQEKVALPLGYEINESAKYDVTFAYDRWEEMSA
jgi:hypothetical protein